MNIVVLAGGTSPERDVSLTSGCMVAAALKKAGHNARMVDLFMGPGPLPQPLSLFFENTQAEKTYTISKDAPDIAALRQQREGGMGDIGENVLEICRAADIVYLGLHGENGEDGRVQAMFDLHGIKYTGTGCLGSAIAMHKGITKKLFEQEGIPTPPGFAARKGDVFKTPQLPCVVKPCSGGSSIGVVIASSEAELKGALEQAFRYEDEVIVETYIGGREFSVGMLGDLVLPPIEIKPKGGFYDYEHKYQAGMTEEICPADISEKLRDAMQDITQRVFKTLKLQVYGRVDFMVDGEGRAFCLEANTLPGMTSLSLLPQEAAAAGISYEQLCARIIELSMEKYK